MNVHGVFTNATFKMQRNGHIDANIRFDQEDVIRLNVKWVGVAGCQSGCVSVAYNGYVVADVTEDLHGVCYVFSNDIVAVLGDIYRLFGQCEVYISSSDVKVTVIETDGVRTEGDLIATFEWLDGAVHIGSHHVLQPQYRYR